MAIELFSRSGNKHKINKVKKKLIFNQLITPTACITCFVGGKLQSVDEDEEETPAHNRAGRTNRRFLERGIAKSNLIESGDDSSTQGTPRRSRRSLSKKSDALLSQDSPGKKAKFSEEDDIEIYDLSSTLVSDASFSEVESPKKSESRSPRKKTLQKVRHVENYQADSASDTSGLSEEEVQQETNRRSARIRTVSQTSGFSATSVESVSSFTRSRCVTADQIETKPKTTVLSQSPRRKNMPASPRLENDRGNSLTIADQKSSSSPTNRTTRRRTMQQPDLQKEGSPNPKKQKVM